MTPTPGAITLVVLCLAALAWGMYALAQWAQRNR
jgi:hypothetical protein